MTQVKLKGRHSVMPALGIGTARALPELVGPAVKYAIKCGYRHFDCAWVYANQDAVGEALNQSIKDSNEILCREDFFLSSKIWYTQNSIQDIRKCLSDTLNELQTSYLDLLILQWPISFKDAAGIEPSHPYTPAEQNVDFIQMYKNLESVLKEGKVRYIGVSNFSKEQLEDILNYCDLKPFTNQIEVHPYLQNDELVEFCRKNDIVVSCYGPLGAGEKNNIPGMANLLDNELLKSIGKKHGKSSAQVCLRWNLQRGICVLPKSTNPVHILANSQIMDFELSKDEMHQIKNINQKLSVYSFEMFKEQFEKPTLKTID